MASCFQAALLVSPPLYPNSVSWSEENLIAIASDHFVTILSPASPIGPRAVITLPPVRPFPIGVVKREDLFYGGLLPTCLSRDCRPCIRSISWSPLGLAPNGGCFLTICTTEGRVKIYGSPFTEFIANWSEIIDISDILFEHLSNNIFGKAMVSSSILSMETTEASKLSEPSNDSPMPLLKNDRRKRKARKLSRNDKAIQTMGGQFLDMTQPLAAVLEERDFPWSTFQEGSKMEVLRQCNLQRTWVSGTVERVLDEKAVISLREDKGNECVEISLACGGYFGEKSDVDISSWCPSARPPINMGTFPEEITCSSLGDFQKNLIGRRVEAWTNDRWLEGVLAGFEEKSLLLKFQGNARLAIMASTFVRLAPIWVAEKKSWRVTSIKVDKTEIKSLNTERAGEGDLQIVPFVQSTSESSKESSQHRPFERIPAYQFNIRSAMLSSLVVSWSPLIYVPAERCHTATTCSLNSSSVLAIGGKSGLISLWKMQVPECYSLEHKGNSAVVLVGLLQAHDTWITAVSWASITFKVSTYLFLLATGSSDGSVKLWKTSYMELLESSGVGGSPFSPLNEVSSGGSGSVSVLAMSIPGRSSERLLLAIGRGSGSLQIFGVDVFAGNCYKISSIDAHDHVVTGLAWAFDGNSLYSTSQDNSLRCWMLQGDSLLETSASSTAALGKKKNPIDVPDAANSCFGVAISPGNLSIAVARGLDIEQLHPMYQARTIKGVVEFIWTQRQDPNKDLSYMNSAHGNKYIPGLSHTDMIKWKFDILWVLTKFEDGDKPLILWDIVTALLSFQHYAPNFVEKLLRDWMAIPTEGSLSCVHKLFMKVSSRKLQILNVICRKVLLPELKAENEISFWRELVQSCEKELRERLVYISLSSDSSRTKDNHLMGIAQVKQWADRSSQHLHEELKLIVRQYEYSEEERCSYCFGLVPFDSPEEAHCTGGHKLQRCSVSMRVCPATPLWFCMCCQRSASVLPLSLFFVVAEFPMGNLYPTDLCPSFKPWCPFCGILLQRFQPDFLLSVSPI